MMRRSPLVLALALFVVAISFGVVFAWDKAAANTKALSVVAGFFVFIVLHWLPQTIRGKDVTRLIAVLAPLVIGVLFILTFDWSYRIGKIGLLDPAMRVLAAIRLPIHGELLNSNSAGGLLAALIPFQAQALFSDWRRDRPLWRSVLAWHGLRAVPYIGSIALLAFSLITLVLSASRGAWIALALVAAFWTLKKFTKRTWLAATIFLVVCGVAASALGNRLLVAVAEDRVPIWTGSLELVSDYAFTGIGPANFAMQYSSYTAMIHVPYLYHAHNLYLDAWLDGGLFGLFALLMIGVVAVTQANRAGTWRAAALAVIFIVGIHGLLDDALYAYAPFAQVLMWIPLALIARISPPVSIRYGLAQLAVAGGAVLATALAVLAVPPIHAVWEANMGALAQVKLELPNYMGQSWGLLDKFRRLGNFDYTEIRAHYQAALALDPNNAMANRRLAQLAIAQGDYASARDKLELAYAAAPQFRATRQMLGEMRALDGKTDEAAALWRTIDNRQSQLQIRLSWYRDFIHDSDRAARVARVLMTLGY